MPTTVAIVQARMRSTRFPGKVMREIEGTPMIGVLLQRLSAARTIDRIVLATSDASANDPLADYVSALGHAVYRGSENDVLDRFYRAAHAAKATAVVRVTGDCPLVDAALIDEMVEHFVDTRVDYASNVEPPTFPDGLDVEVFSIAALEKAWREATAARDREHVTTYLRDSGKFTKSNWRNSADTSADRWTVDEPADLIVVQRIFEHFRPRRDFHWREVMVLKTAHPEVFADNQHLNRNEGSRLDTGQKLWQRAKRVIPGGNMFLSKRSEMFLPEYWPAYYSRAEGCRVWDLDGRELIDMALMGVGTNTLGYAHPEVDHAVRAAIAASNMSSLNCPEEVYLAERLVELHPWADMVRMARSGGEVNAVAIRIARAAAGRDKVAICGYHGWHDWYLAANLGDDQTLAGHLLPGLEPRGVPQHLRGSVLPFNYNDYDALEELVANHDVGVIKMEVSRNMGPAEGFLQKVRALATSKNIVLIFDECTSGFRQTFGGLHKLYGVEPDMAMFGKTLGNGYAITATIGRREIMEAAQTTFISSTFWSERIGPTAGLKTLEIMEQLKSWEQITAIGNSVRSIWTSLAARHELNIQISGMPALSSFSFDSPDMLKYKTLISQEMLKKGFLASTAVYTCIAHTPEIIARYESSIDSVFAIIAQCERGDRSIDALLDGPVCHAGFKRLN